MNKSIIVLSGGQDSATTMAKAATKTSIEAAIHFQYGQKHAVERECAQFWADKYGVPLHVVDVPSLAQVGDSALTHNGNTNEPHPQLEHLPSSFVPGRNLVFLKLAAALAMKLDATEVWTGVCQTDYSGYPDCRLETIQALEHTIQIGMSFSQLAIVTPLMHLDKADTFKLAADLGVLEDVLEHTHTDYDGDRTTRHPWGYGNLNNPASQIRAKGWKEYQARYGV
jgi:7-cyano-7-deazaguanine synthase